MSATLDKPISGLTTQDLVDYINDLSTQAGIMSKDEIQKYVNTIADKAGVMTQDELNNLVKQFALEANVVSKDTITEMVTELVYTKINDLNDNKEFILEVRDDLNKEIASLNVKERALERTLSDTKLEIANSENRTSSDLTKLKSSLILVENTIKNIQENKEVLDLINLEQQSRKELDKKLNEKIDKNADLALSNNFSKVSKEVFDSKINDLKTQIILSNDVRYNTTSATLRNIQNDITLQKSKLNNLLLNNDDFLSKLTILADLDTLDTKENLNLIAHMSDKISDSTTASEKALVYMKNLEIRLDKIVNEINKDITVNKSNLISEKTERVIKDKQLSSNLEENVLKTEGLVSHLRDDVAKFENEINLRFNNSILELNKINDKLISDYRNIYDMVKDESALRQNANKAIDLNINKMFQDMKDIISDNDKSDDIIKLDTKLNDFYSEFINDKNVKDKRLVELQKQFDLLNKNSISYKDIIISRIDNEEQSRKDSINDILSKLHLEIETRQETINKVSETVSTLRTDVLDKLLDPSTSNTDGTVLTQEEKDNIFKVINNFSVDTYKNKESLLTLERTVSTLSDTITNNNNLINTTLANKESNILNSLSAEINERSINNDYSVKAINDLQVSVNNIISSTTDINLSSLSNDIKKVNNDLTLFINQVSDKFENIITALDNRVFNAENCINVLKVNLSKETQERIKEDILLSDGIKGNSDTIQKNYIEIDARLNSILSKYDLAISELKVILKNQQEEYTDFSEASKQALLEAKNILNVRIDTNVSDIESMKSGISELSTTLTTKVTLVEEENLKNYIELGKRLDTESDVRIKEVTELTNSIQAEREKIDALLDGSTEDFDSLKEIMDYIRNLKVQKEEVLGNLLADIKKTNLLNISKFEDEAKTRTEKDNDLQTSLMNEAKFREDSDQEFLEKLNSEINERINEVKRIQTLIETHEVEALDKFKKVQETTDEINEVILKTTSNYKDADAGLLQKVNNLRKYVDNSVQILVSTIDDNKENGSKDLLEAKEEFKNSLDNVQAEINEIKTSDEAFTANVAPELRNLKAVYDLIDKNKNDNSVVLSETLDQLHTKLNEVTINLSNEVRTRTTDIDSLNAALTNEVSNRVNDSSNISKRVDTEVKDLNEKIKLNVTDISAERSIRSQEILDLKNKLDTETKNRSDNDLVITNDIVEFKKDNAENLKNLDTKINDNFQTTTDGLTSLNNNLEAEIVNSANRSRNLDTKINDEIDRAVALDAQLSELANSNKQRIDEILLDSNSQLDSFKEINEALVLNRNESIKSDTDLDNKFINITDTLDANISSEVSVRTTETKALNDNLNTEINSRKVNIDQVNKTISDMEAAQTDVNDKLRNSINDEIFTRIDQNKNISDKLNTEIQDRVSVVQEVKDNLSNEVSTRQDQVKTLDDKITETDSKIVNFSENLKNESDDRISQDNILDGKIDELHQIVDTIFEGTTDDLNSFKEVVNLIRTTDLENDNNLLNFANSVKESLDLVHTNISSETQNRISSENKVIAQIHLEVSDRISSVKDLADKINEEINNRIDQDTVLLNDIKTYSKDIDDNVKSLISSVQSDIDNIRLLVVSVNNNLDSEISERLDSETSIKNLITELDTRLNDQDSLINSRLITEVKERQEEDTTIHEKIQALEDSSNSADNTLANKIDNVADIVSKNNDSAINLVNTEVKIRTDEIARVEKLIEDSGDNLEKGHVEINQHVSDLSDKIESILDGSDIDLDEFKEIVKVLNDIDSDNDVIKEIKQIINIKIANLNSLRITDKEIVNSKLKTIINQCTGLIDHQNLVTKDLITTATNSIYARVANDFNKQVITTTDLNNRIISIINVRERNLKTLTDYINSSLDNENTSRVNQLNNFRLELLNEIDQRKVELTNLETIFQKERLIESGTRAQAIQRFQDILDTEIAGRTKATNELQETVNLFTDKISENFYNFTETINTNIDKYIGTIVGEIEVKKDDDTVSTNLVESVNLLNSRSAELEDKIKTEIIEELETGKIIVGSSAGTSTGNLDTSSIMDAVNSKILSKIQIEKDRAVTSENVLDEKILKTIEELHKTKADLLNKDRILKREINDDLGNKIIYANTNISSNRKDIDKVRSSLTSEIKTRSNEDNILLSKINKLNSEIEKVSKDVSVIDTSSSTLKTEVIVNTNNLILEKTKDLYKIQDDLKIIVQDNTSTINITFDEFKNTINEIENKQYDHQTSITNLTASVNQILEHSDVDLDSLKELVDYINNLDTDVLTTQLNMNTNIGLTSTGDFINYTESYYINSSTNIANAIEKLDYAMNSEMHRNDESIKNIIEDLKAEVQAREKLSNDVFALIEVVREGLSKEIKNNLAKINSNLALIKQLRLDLGDESNQRIAEDILTRQTVGLNEDGSLTIEDTTYLNDETIILDAIKVLDEVANSLQTQIGNLDDLDTEDKDDLVSAINETLKEAKAGHLGNEDLFDQSFANQ